MMNRRKMISYTFVKYFISYFIIFSIPLAVLGVFIYHNAVTSLREEIVESNMSKLKQAKDVVDLQMSGMKQIAARVTFNPRLTPYMLKNEAKLAGEAVIELGQYKAYSSIVDELFLYLRDSDVVYSSDGLNSLTTLTRYYYHFEHWDEKQFMHDINSIVYPIIRPAEQVSLAYNRELKRYLTYLVPVPFNDPLPYATMLFVIDETLLTKQVENILGGYDGSVFILDENKRILAAKSQGKSDQSDELSRMLGEINGTGHRQIRYQNEQYSLAVMESEINGWTYIHMMPTSQFLSRVLEKKALVTAILVSLIVLGLGAAVVLSSRFYRPIRNLANHVSGLWTQGKNGGRNELEIIRETLDQMLNTIHDQQPAMKERYLMKLLQGNLDGQQDLNDQNVQQVLKLSGSLFVVMLISLGGRKTMPENPSRLEEVLGLSGHLSFSGGIAYGVELVHEHAAALILNFNSEHSDNMKETLQSLAHNWRRLVRENVDCEPAIGIGMPYGSLQQVNRSFIEASAALEYKLKGAAEGIIFFEDIMPLHETVSWYPVEDYVRFVQSLKRGDKTVALEMLKEMIASISGTPISILIIRCKCFDIINTVLKTIGEMQVDYSSHLKSLLDFVTLEELEYRLNVLITEVCDDIEKHKQSKNVVLRDGILSFVHEYYQSYELSLDRLAEHFQLSVSYLSRFFKEQTGKNFSEYLSGLRMEEMKRRLITTNKPITELVAEIGYEDVSQFRRKFKKLEGITPGEYRTLYSNK